MMIPTQPEESYELDPVMWAVWQYDPTGEDLRIERIVADKETAERVATSLNLLRRTPTGCFSGRASGLVATVQEQGRLLDHAQLTALIAELAAEVHEIRQAVASSRPAINLIPGEAEEHPMDGATVKPWWEITHKGV